MGKSIALTDMDTLDHIRASRLDFWRCIIEFESGLSGIVVKVDGAVPKCLTIPRLIGAMNGHQDWCENSLRPQGLCF